MSDEVPEGEQSPARPHRVIGTPLPVPSSVDVAERESDSAATGREKMPADPADPVSAKRAERIVAACFIVAFIAGIGFIAAYVGLEVGPLDAVLRSNLALGLSLSVALTALGLGSLLWVRRVMPNVETAEQRHPMRSPSKDREAFQEYFAEATETSQFVKRPLLRRTLMLATLPLAAIPIVVLRDLGPLPGTSLRYTVWKRGTRAVVYGTNRPLTPAEFNTPGSMITVIPEGYEDDQDALAKAGVILIKFAPGELHIPTNYNGGTLVSTMNWTVDNIVAYSKICTHVGCPVALYEQTTHHILCPCHQSTFDAANGANVIFGPAARALPQLPLTLNSQGQLVAASDFTQPVGPSFWERG
ncbi:MAG: Rieske (2Fe-2S) protein [Streptosporangiaceae bacterium]|nr:Rieske (2Fe-2S) protein [Streptosporangiaceae bacterium]MBV9857905.1 Rieske (2Fe-2S) protein [Streptosporangiaceae bacterium]